MHYLFTLFLLLATACLHNTLWAAEAPPSETAKIFERYSNAVVKIQLINIDSGAKSVIGTGFFVDDQGYLVTNYHVVSNWVNEPKKYRVEYLDQQKKTHPLRILNIDVLNDLAIAKADIKPEVYFDFSNKSLAQGARILSFGFPRDFNVSIVEGTYNGLLNHAFYDKIHFTGSLNSGMSGGPAVDVNGQVIGVNVATSGNQMSFLVPVHYAKSLYQETYHAAYKVPEKFQSVIAKQLAEHQSNYVLNKLFLDKKQVTLGNYLLPTSPATFFNCWGSSNNDDIEKHASSNITAHQCDVEDYLFLSESQRVEPAYMRHYLISSNSLNDYQFAKLLTNYFEVDKNRFWADKELVGKFKCQSHALTHQGLKFKTAFCARKYQKLGDLYDVVFKLVSLGKNKQAIVSELVLFGVRFETGEEVTKRYLELFTWKE